MVIKFDRGGGHRHALAPVMPMSPICYVENPSHRRPYPYGQVNPRTAPPLHVSHKEQGHPP